MRKLITTMIAVAAALVVAAPATAATVTPFGGATKEGNNFQLVSNLADASTTNNFSGISITGLGDLQLSELQTLSAMFNTDDGCGGGSPRFVLILDNGTAVNVAWGPSPNFTGCQLNAWISTGNLVGQTDGCRWHITSPASQADPCLTPEEIAALGSRTITEVRVIVDSGWFFSDQEQSALVCDVRINNMLLVPCAGETPAPATKNAAQACRQQRALMGVEAFRTAYGTNVNKRNAFGKCVSMMAKAKKNGEAADLQTAILAATLACQAEGKTGAELGTCVKSRTSADRANALKAKKTKATKPNKGKSKP
jgi:hypothetical protein